jgi:hypothetical protein
LPRDLLTALNSPAPLVLHELDDDFSDEVRSRFSMPSDEQIDDAYFSNTFARLLQTKKMRDTHAERSMQFTCFDKIAIERNDPSLLRSPMFPDGHKSVIELLSMDTLWLIIKSMNPFDKIVFTNLLLDKFNNNAVMLTALSDIAGYAEQKVEWHKFDAFFQWSKQMMSIQQSTYAENSTLKPILQRLLLDRDAYIVPAHMLVNCLQFTYGRLLDDLKVKLLQGVEVANAQERSIERMEDEARARLTTSEQRHNTFGYDKSGIGYESANTSSDASDGDASDTSATSYSSMEKKPLTRMNWPRALQMSAKTWYAPKVHNQVNYIEPRFVESGG